jgi:predicted metal-dependent hydrolase
MEEKKKKYQKLQSLFSKEEQAKAHCFEELAAVRLQVSNLNIVLKQQQHTIQSLQEVIETKQKTLEELKIFVNFLEEEKKNFEKTQEQKILQAEIIIQAYENARQKIIHQQELLRQELEKFSCDKCEEYKQKIKVRYSLFFFLLVYTIYTVLSLDGCNMFCC